MKRKIPPALLELGDDWISRNEAAALLGVHPARMGILAVKGQGPAYIIGNGASWYREADVRAYGRARLKVRTFNAAAVLA